MKMASGKCLCGSVKVSFPLEKEVFDACHCGMCRKWSGGPGLTVETGGKAKFEGEDFISVYDSSEWAQRGFCKQCGTHLFYRMKKGNFCNVPLGLLEKNEDLKFHVQIYTDSKPANYSFADKTIEMTEAEVIAMFTGN